VSLHVELLLRIAAATALGAVIGLERQIHGRPAGLRTHILVALASASFMVVSTHFVYFHHYRREDLVTVDTSRIAASVVAGTGFLAGGAILRTGLTVQGLTTGAGLWLVSSIGLAAGGGMFPESVDATAIGLVALSGMRRFQRKDDGTVRCRIAVTMTGGVAAVPGLLSVLREQGCTAAESEYESAPGERRLTVTLDVQAPSGRAASALVGALESQPGVTHLRVSGSG
jgi:putative Mg2+ transporter-C (MgtC) family protein